MLPKTVEEMHEMGWSPFRKSKGSDLTTICLPSTRVTHPPIQPGMTGWSQIKQMDVDLSLLQCL